MKMRLDILNNLNNSIRYGICKRSADMISNRLTKQPASNSLMKHISFFLTVMVLSGILPPGFNLFAQPAQNANKFLGNITTYGRVRSDFMEYWNQITGENESKWASIEGTRDEMNWSGTDRIADFARENGIPWKFHCLIWGSQYPGWMNNLSQSEQLEEIIEWMDEAAERYPDVQMIDVVNEAYPSHEPAPFKNALGGDGQTGFDWIIKSFEMARECWPNAILIYNDFNTIEWDSEVNWMVKLANALKEAEAPMDVIGVQAHDVCNRPTNLVKNNIDKLAATGYPIMVSEYDIGRTNDGQQKDIMEDQFTMFWNHPKVVGITYWGYIVGRTWRNGTGLMDSNGNERPALTWLVDYVKDNPEPPNDYPDLIPETTGIRKPHGIKKSISSAINVSTNIVSSAKIFDLRGRTIGMFQIRNLTETSPAPGNYIIRGNSICKKMISRLR